jgi:hypothetical protein
VIRIFSGYDPRTAVGHHVFAHSVQRRSTETVNIAPLRSTQLHKTFNRPRHPLQSTDFAFTRFLVPYLCDYEGWALFVDGADMVCCADIADLWAMRDKRYAVQVVKHDMKYGKATKFLGQKQTPYERKNWSSLILFNCERCQRLTPEVVAKEDGLWLHQFRWLEDAEIGALPKAWNYLVDVEEPGFANILHYTLGIPPLMHTRDEYAREVWHNEAQDLYDEITVLR